MSQAAEDGNTVDPPDPSIDALAATVERLADELRSTRQWIADLEDHLGDLNHQVALHHAGFMIAATEVPRRLLRVAPVNHSLPA